MNITKPLITFILAMNILSCNSNSNLVSGTEQGVKNTNTISIKTQPDKYALIMSSTIGISLEPVINDINNYSIMFTTQNGNFKLWDNSGKITELGKSAKYSNQKIYWTYNDSEKFTENLITVTVSDKSGKIVDTKTINLIADKEGFFSVK